MTKMTPYSIRSTETQSEQLAYLTTQYGSQSSAIRVAIDLLFTLRRLEDLGIFDRLDTDNLLRALKDPAVLPGK